MELNFVEDEAKSLVLEFIDVDRGIPEMLRAKLQDSKDVEFAGVVKERPDISSIKLIVKAGKNPRTLVAKAAEDIQENIKALAASLPKK